MENKQGEVTEQTEIPTRLLCLHIKIPKNIGVEEGRIDGVGGMEADQRCMWEHEHQLKFTGINRLR